MSGVSAGVTIRLKLVTPRVLGLMIFLGRLRRRTIVVTDQRVRFMNELLTCVKFIKMYAWEKPFSRTISGTDCFVQVLLYIN